MENLSSIVVSVNRQDDANLVLEKAQQLAAASGAAVHVVRVVDESILQPHREAYLDMEERKTFIMQAERSCLEDLIDPYRRGFAKIDSATIWNKDHYQGIINAADEWDADLIIKMSKAATSSHLTSTPEDWKLLRNSPVPVMVVKPKAWVNSPAILAAIDVLNPEHRELNVQILEAANRLAKILSGDLHLLNAYHLSKSQSGENTIGMDFEKIRREIENETKLSLDELLDQVDIEFTTLHIREGKPSMVIKGLIDELNAQILAIGATARAGIPSYILGNTSETVLPYVNTDVLCVGKAIHHCVRPSMVYRLNLPSQPG